MRILTRASKRQKTLDTNQGVLSLELLPSSVAHEILSNLRNGQTALALALSSRLFMKNYMSHENLRITTDTWDTASDLARARVRRGDGSSLRNIECFNCRWPLDGETNASSRDFLAYLQQCDMGVEGFEQAAPRHLGFYMSPVVHFSDAYVMPSLRVLEYVECPFSNPCIGGLSILDILQTSKGVERFPSLEVLHVEGCYTEDARSKVTKNVWSCIKHSNLKDLRYTAKYHPSTCGDATRLELFCPKLEHLDVAFDLWDTPREIMMHGAPPLTQLALREVRRVTFCDSETCALCGGRGADECFSQVARLKICVGYRASDRAGAAAASDVLARSRASCRQLKFRGGALAPQSGHGREVLPPMPRVWKLDLHVYAGSADKDVLDISGFPCLRYLSITPTDFMNDKLPRIHRSIPRGLSAGSSGSEGRATVSVEGFGFYSGRSRKAWSNLRSLLRALWPKELYINCTRGLIKDGHYRYPAMAEEDCIARNYKILMRWFAQIGRTTDEFPRADAEKGRMVVRLHVLAPVHGHVRRWGNVPPHQRTQMFLVVDEP